MAGGPTDPAAVFDARMVQSARAAQALQGDLDGRWVLRSAGGERLMVLQIADPPQHAAPLTAAWAAPGGGAPAPVALIARSGERLEIVLGDTGRPAGRLTLSRIGGVWRGALAGPPGPAHRVTAVTMRREP